MIVAIVRKGVRISISPILFMEYKLRTLVSVNPDEELVRLWPWVFRWFLGRRSGGFRENVLGKVLLARKVGQVIRPPKRGL